MKALKKRWKMLFTLSLKLFLFSWLFGHVEKRLDQNDVVTFKLYEVTTWETNNKIDILPNILRNKGNQTMKFGWLLGY